VVPLENENRSSCTVQITGRERAVIECVGFAMTNQEIAAALGIGVNTVKTHLQHVYEKLGVTNRRAALYAVSGVRPSDCAKPLSKDAPISARERVILSYAAAGMTNREIAELCYISIHTVTSHIKHACHKLGASSRREAARIAATCQTHGVTTAA
jgi:DNA-binding CsgD family transcriptional regulator